MFIHYIIKHTIWPRVISNFLKKTQVKDTDLYVNRGFMFIGASADSLIAHNCHQLAVLEIKYPIKYKNMKN